MGKGFCEQYAREGESSAIVTFEDDISDLLFLSAHMGRL
jgi:hypothetical protein